MTGIKLSCTLCEGRQIGCITVKAVPMQITFASKERWLPKWLLRTRVVPENWDRYCVNSKWFPVVMLKDMRTNVQFVPHSKHTVSVIETNRLVLYGEIMIGCSEVFNKHRTIMGREWNYCTVHVVKVKPPLYRPGQALRSQGDWGLARTSGFLPQRPLEWNVLF
jgi:hypothetical protein